MNGNKLLDTNIIIYLSKKMLLLEEVATPDSQLFVSVITYMEALGYIFNDKDEEKFITDFFKTVFVIQLDERIIEDVIKTRKKKKIKLPDAIIYSTAKITNLALVTENDADFKGLNGGVKIINPIK